jgi:hypothetical protein
MATAQERISAVQQEVRRLLTEEPSVRYELIGALSEIFAQKTDLQAILERIDAQGERIDTLGKHLEEQGERIDTLGKHLEEQGERIDTLGKRLEEQGERIEALREDFNRQFAEHSRQIAALRQDFNRGFAQLFARMDSLEATIGGLGARWGMMTESAFREGLAGILAREAGLEVKHYWKMDTSGTVFQHPAPVEIDIVVRDGEHTLIEITSSAKRHDVDHFWRKLAFYEREEKVKVKRMIIISPMFGPGAQELAQELGMEVYTSAYDVRA